MHVHKQNLIQFGAITASTITFIINVYFATVEKRKLSRDHRSIFGEPMMSAFFSLCPLHVCVPLPFFYTNLRIPLYDVKWIAIPLLCWVVVFFSVYLCVYVQAESILDINVSNRLIRKTTFIFFVFVYYLCIPDVRCFFACFFCSFSFSFFLVERAMCVSIYVTVCLCFSISFSRKISNIILSSRHSFICAALVNTINLFINL